MDTTIYSGEQHKILFSTHYDSEFGGIIDYFLRRKLVNCDFREDIINISHQEIYNYLINYFGLNCLTYKIDEQTIAITYDKFTFNGYSLNKCIPKLYIVDFFSYRF